MEPLKKKIFTQSIIIITKQKGFDLQKLKKKVNVYLTCGGFDAFNSWISFITHRTCTYRPVHFRLTFCSLCTSVSKFTRVLTYGHVTSLRLETVRIWLAWFGCFRMAVWLWQELFYTLVDQLLITVWTKKLSYWS